MSVAEEAMKSEYYTYLLEVHHCGSISTAAKALRIQPSTLNSIVKSAEDELGFPLFFYTPNGVTTTPMGRKFMALAWEISLQYEMLTHLQSRYSPGIPPIDFLLCPSANVYLPIALAERYAKFELNGDLRFQEYVRTDVVKTIQDDTANIGITYMTDKELAEAENSPQFHNIAVEILRSDKLCVLAPKGHAAISSVLLAGGSLRHLENESIALLANLCAEDSRRISQVIACEKNRIISYPNIETLIIAVAENHVLGMLPEFAVYQAHERKDDLQIIPLGAEFTYNICLLYRKGRSLRNQEDILKSCVYDYFQELPKQLFQKGAQG